VGVALENGPAARPLYFGMFALQHRGQESAGIVTHDGFQQHDQVGMGLVGDVFDEDDLDSLAGSAGIGHVRYPTAGSVDAACAQPFSVSFKGGSLGLAHNGNLVNTATLRDELGAKGHAFTSDGDTEVIAHDLARNLLSGELVPAVKQTVARLRGSYALTIMHDDTVMGLRDPEGNRPLCLGELENGYVLASESTAIDTLDGELLRDVRPGELIRLHPNGTGYDAHQLVEVDRTAHCFFEYVYFARPDSVLDGRIVYEVRRELGRQLWAENGVETDVVLPVPDSGRASASGYAAAALEAGADTELAEGLMKNRYVGRTFIMPTQRERERSVRLKLNAIRNVVAGKTVTLVDDSIVRGTTASQLVALLREAGAEAVHLRIGSPPVVAPCYMGIDMASRDELIAANRSVEAITDAVEADSLAYLSVDAIADVLDLDRADLCLGCVTGEYPYAIKGETTDRDTAAEPQVRSDGGTEPNGVDDGLSYAEAGVDIGASEAATAALVDAIESTGSDDYAGVVDVGNRYLGLSTDGVGTKLLVAAALADFSTVGIDCVAMNVNDLVAAGIDPVAFVDYLAVDEPDEAVAEQLGTGLATGAREAGVTLVGGETAVMPEIVSGLDLAGTCVGLAGKSDVFEGVAQAGDALVGWPSNGIHANGLTLARAAVTREHGYADPFPPQPDRTIGEVLLEPTRQYTSLLTPMREHDVHAAAHITGGGWTNLSRLSSFRYVIDDPWPIHPVFDFVQTAGSVPDEEMHRTFNMGTGFVAAVPTSTAAALAETTDGRVIGRVERGDAVSIRGMQL
jgi:amidophosphoribosyltransferase